MSSFAFLEQDSPQLYEQILNAEDQYRHGDAVSCVNATRAFGEMVVWTLIDAYNLQGARETQYDRIEDLYDSGKIDVTVRGCLHKIRVLGNEAIHNWYATQVDAFQCLQHAYKLSVILRSILAPRCKLPLSSIQQYSGPQFGELKAEVDSLRLENAQLKAHLKEISNLIEASDDDEDGANSDESRAEQNIESPIPMFSREDIVRLWRIKQSRALRRRYRIARKRRRSMDHVGDNNDTQVWENPSDLWYQITRLRDEVEQSFIAERDFAVLLARKHKAVLIRRRFEAEGREWPESWNAELDRIEQQLSSLGIERWKFNPNEVDGSEESICRQILEGMRRQAIADALRQAYRDHDIEWRPELSHADRALRRAVDHLWDMEASLPDKVPAMAATE